MIPTNDTVMNVTKDPPTIEIKLTTSGKKKAIAPVNTRKDRVVKKYPTFDGSSILKHEKN